MRLSSDFRYIEVVIQHDAVSYGIDTESEDVLFQLLEVVQSIQDDLL